MIKKICFEKGYWNIKRRKLSVLYSKTWVTFCLDTRKSFKSVILGDDVFLNSQEAYKLKIYMIAFIESQ